MPPNDQPQTNSTQANPTATPSVEPAAPAAKTEVLHVPHKPVPESELAETPSETPPTTSQTAEPVVSIVPPIPASAPTPEPVAEVKEEVVVEEPVTILSIEEQIKEKEQAMQEFAEGRLRIEEGSRTLFSTRKKLEEQLEPIIAEEKFSISKINTFEKKKSAAKTPAEARAAEKERWVAEEERREIERRKWPISEQLDEVIQNIKEVERQFKTLAAEEENCRMAIAQLQVKAKQRDLALELEKIEKDKGATETELEKFRAERTRLDELLREMIAKEQEAIKAEKAIDREAEGVQMLYEERVLADERHKLEDARKEAEQKRWEAEDAIPPIEHATDEVRRHLDEIKKKEREIQTKLDALAKQSTPRES